MEYKLSEVNTTTLAFMGDAVYEQYIRRFLIKTGCPGSGHADALHKIAVSYVCAKAQAKNIKKMIDDGFLTEKETALVKRARNRKSATKPKNADAVEYKWATAFEALLGWLYLSENTERLEEIMAKTVAQQTA